MCSKLFFKAIPKYKIFQSTAAQFSKSVKGPIFSTPAVLNKINMLSKKDYEAFIGEFPEVLNDLVSLEGFEKMTETQEWMQKVVEYNVPHGKLLRSILLLSIAKSTQKKTGKELPNLNRIAWAAEFFQAFATIVDDMVDQSKTRRDRPCWYLVENLGPAAINDGLLLESAGYVLLMKYVKGHYQLYEDLMELLHVTSLKGLYGQSLDGRISTRKQFDRFTIEIYNKMMTFKNGYYTFSTPIISGLMLNGINDPRILKKVKEFALDLGLFYSIQDDYIDCFVDAGKSGKIGTDIEDGKPCWLIVTALERANKAQREILLNNYGNSDPGKVAKVKRVYEEMDISGIYKKFEKDKLDNLLRQIQELPEIVPQEPLQQMVNLLFGRTR